MAAIKGRAQRPHFNPQPRANDAWKEQAACTGTDPEAFFPEHSRHVTLGARRVCDGCPVRAECLEYALAHKEWYGTWGGLSVDQRRELVRARRAVKVGSI